MRLTFVCLRCKIKTRRGMPQGKGGLRQGVVRCPNCRGPKVREDCLPKKTRKGT